MKTDYENALNGEFEYGQYEDPKDIHKALEDCKTVILHGKIDWFIVGNARIQK